VRCNLIKAWLAAALGGGLVLGCRSADSSNLLPEDPLLLSKKPVEGKLETAAPAQVARKEPVAAPALLASEPVPPPAPPKPLLATVVNKEPPPAAHALTAAPVVPVPAVPASRPVNATPPATLAVRRQVAGNYGHAADYTWLQGVLDRHYQGHLDLRYCDHTVDDPHGGKVCLEGDPRLAQFKDGDVVGVEGELIPEPDQAGRTPWHRYPHYRVRDVWLVQHAK
jgi:hypothetical protein